MKYQGEMLFKLWFYTKKTELKKALIIRKKLEPIISITI